VCSDRVLKGVAERKESFDFGHNRCLLWYPILNCRAAMREQVASSGHRVDMGALSYSKEPLHQVEHRFHLSSSVTFRARKRLTVVACVNLAGRQQS
jgi:hypothetical protein